MDGGRWLIALAIVTYVLAQIGVGVWIGRRVKSDVDFFLGGRRMTMAPIAIALFSTWFGAEAIMGSTGAVAQDGLSGSRAEPFGYAICLFFMAFLVAVPFRAKGYLNLADFVRKRFDHHSEVATALLTILPSTIWAAAQLLALSELFQIALGVPAAVTVGAAMLVVLVYTSLAGLAGDVYTDMMHTVLVVIGVCVILFMLAGHFGGWGSMLAQITPQQLALVKPGETWLARIDSFAIPIMGSLVTQEAIAYILSTRNAETARAATLTASGIYALMGIVPLLIALVGVHVMPVGDDPDSFLVRLAQHVLPPGLFVLYAGALLSAVMSVTNANVLSVSSMVSINLLSRLHATASEALKVRVARYATIGAGLAAFLIASSGQSIYSLIALTSVWGQAGILVAVLFGVWTNYGGPRAALTGIAFCVADNLWTLTFDPLLRLMSGPEARPFGEAFAALVQGEAPTMDGYFLSSVVASVVGYAVGAAWDARRARLSPV